MPSWIVPIHHSSESMNCAFPTGSFPFSISPHPPSQPIEITCLSRRSLDWFYTQFLCIAYECLNAHAHCAVWCVWISAPKRQSELPVNFTRACNGHLDNAVATDKQWIPILINDTPDKVLLSRVGIHIQIWQICHKIPVAKIEIGYGSIETQRTDNKSPLFQGNNKVNWT